MFSFYFFWLLCAIIVVASSLATPEKLYLLVGTMILVDLSLIVCGMGFKGDFALVSAGL